MNCWWGAGLCSWPCSASHNSHFPDLSKSSCPESFPSIVSFTNLQKAALSPGVCVIYNDIKSCWLHMDTTCYQSPFGQWAIDCSCKWRFIFYFLLTSWVHFPLPSSWKIWYLTMPLSSCFCYWCFERKCRHSFFFFTLSLAETQSSKISNSRQFTLADPANHHGVEG